MNLVGTSPCTGTVGSYTTLTYPNDTTYTTKQVAVTLRIQQSLPFSSLFMSAAPVIQASATAGSVIQGGDPCMLALNPSGTAINNSGNTTVTAPTCIFYSDSASSNSAAAGGSSAITARAVAGVGGIQSSNNWNVQQYLPYSPALPDPLASITPATSDMKCAGHWVTHGQSSTWVNDALTDGVDITTLRDASGNQANCFSSLSVGSNRTLSIPPSYTGPIYISGGDVNLQGAFSCGACTIVLTNSDPSSTTVGTFSSNAQATNNITAPTSGTYKGIAVFQDRRATGGNIDKINGGSGNVISGVVYFPKDTLWLNGTGSAVSLCSMFIANNLVFNGTGQIAISAASDASCSGSNLPTGGVTVVRLVA